MQTTIAHFLQMLTDQKIDSIVMLTKTYEQRPGIMILKNLNSLDICNLTVGHLFFRRIQVILFKIDLAIFLHTFT